MILYRSRRRSHRFSRGQIRIRRRRLNRRRGSSAHHHNGCHHLYTIYIRARAKNASKCSAVSDDDDDESSFPKEGMDKTTQLINPKLTKKQKNRDPSSRREMKKTGKTHVSRPALALACKKVDILSLLFLFQRGKVSRLHRTQRRERFISVYNLKGSGTYSTRKTQQQRKKTRMIANALRREARKALTGIARRLENLVRPTVFFFLFRLQISWHFVSVMTSFPIVSSTPRPLCFSLFFTNSQYSFYA